MYSWAYTAAMSYLFISNWELFKKNNSKLYFKPVVIKNKVVTDKAMSYSEACGLLAAFVLHSLDLLPLFLLACLKIHNGW